MTDQPPQSAADRLRELKGLHDDGLISDDEFEGMRAPLLKDLGSTGGAIDDDAVDVRAAAAWVRSTVDSSDSVTADEVEVGSVGRADGREGDEETSVEDMEGLPDPSLGQRFVANAAGWVVYSAVIFVLYSGLLFGGGQITLPSWFGGVLGVVIFIAAGYTWVAVRLKLLARFGVNDESLELPWPFNWWLTFGVTGLAVMAPVIWAIFFWGEMTGWR